MGKESLVVEQLYLVTAKYCLQAAPLTMIDIISHLEKLFLPDEIFGNNIFGDGAKNHCYWNNISSNFVQAMIRIWKEGKLCFCSCDEQIYTSDSRFKGVGDYGSMKWIPIMLETFNDFNKAKSLNLKFN